MNALERYRELAATNPPEGRDLLAAWDVVERMRERGYYLRLEPDLDYDRPEQWKADYFSATDRDWVGEYHAATAADAILGAATAAMEGEGE